MSMTFREWKRDDIDIRAALAKDIEYQASEDSGVEVADLWVLLISLKDHDHWLACGVVDTLDEEPEAFLIANTPEMEQIKKMSIPIGDRWIKLEQALMPLANRHRRLVSNIEPVIEEVMSQSYEDLLERRVKSDWKTTTNFWKHLGIQLSLN